MRKSEGWITENFESLVSKYGGKYIGVVRSSYLCCFNTEGSSRECEEVG